MQGLAHLLTDDEHQEIAEAFEDLDTNGDGVISRSEYIDYQRRLEERTVGRSLKPEEIEDLMIFWLQDFAVRDNGLGGGVSGDDMISWWEFLEFEALNKLRSRGEENLIQFLQDDEIKEARKHFDRFDINGDGRVTRAEAVESSVGWMKALRQKGFFSAMSRESAEQHLRTRVELFMEADRDNDNIVTWEEYLQHQVLFILRIRAERKDLGLGCDDDDVAPAASSQVGDDGKIPLSVFEG